MAKKTNEPDHGRVAGGVGQLKPMVLAAQVPLPRVSVTSTTRPRRSHSAISHLSLPKKGSRGSAEVQVGLQRWPKGMRERAEAYLREKKHFGERR